MTTARLFFAQFLLWLFMATNPASAAANLTMADLQNGIGDGVTKGLYQEGDLAHAALHGLVGCAAAEALDGNCASGAAAAIAQSIYAGTQEGEAPERDEYGSDQEYLAAHGAWKANLAQQANLIGASVGYVTSGGSAANVNNGASIARSGALNNYLKHTELARARALFDERENLERQITRLASECLFCNAEEIRLLSAQLDQIALQINELQTTSAANTLALMAACDVGNTTDCQTLRTEAAYYLDNTDGWFGMEARLGRVFDVSAGAMEGVDVDWGGNLDRWLTDAYDVAALDSNADWGVIDSSVADYAIARDGWINIGVGTGAVAVSVLGCIGTSGLGCAAIVGGAVLAESNTIYDGAATVITGNSQDGYIKNLLLAAEFTDAEADQYERWIENGLAVATIGIDGVIVIRSTSGALLNTGRQTVSDFVATNRTLPDGYTDLGGGRYSGPGGGIAFDTGKVDAAGNLILRRESGGYCTVGSNGNQVSVPSPYTDGAPPVHHVCTNKNCVSTANGGPWTPQFQEFFDNAGLNINGEINKIAVPGHQGPHPTAYHQYVYGQLDQATQGLTPNTSGYTNAVTNTLNNIKVEAVTPGNQVNDWLTGNY